MSYHSAFKTQEYLEYLKRYDSDKLPVVFDEALFRKTLDWVREEAAKPAVDSEWYQATWAAEGEEIGRSCGTAFCFAGYAAHIAGLNYVHRSGAAVVTADGRRCSTGRAASELLGITGMEADLLFEGSNTLATIEALAAAIMARRGLEL